MNRRAAANKEPRTAAQRRPHETQADIDTDHALRLQRSGHPDLSLLSELSRGSFQANKHQQTQTTAC